MIQTATNWSLQNKMTESTQASSPQVPAFFDSSVAELRLAAEAAQAAGRIIADSRGQLVAMDQKSAGDLVSEVDVRADETISACLQSSGDPILSEELRPDEQAGRQRLWIVDPLDSSTSYLMGGEDQDPSVLIAHVQDGRAQVGLAHFPLTQEWFYAIRGQGAYRNGQTLSLTGPCQSLANAWVELNVYGDAAQETSWMQRARHNLRSSNGAKAVTSGFPCSGKALRLAEQQTGLAAIVHDNCPQFLKQGPWDIAAVQLILEEAGGVFVNSQLQAVDPFTAEPMIVAASMELARQIVRCVG